MTLQRSAAAAAFVGVTLLTAACGSASTSTAPSSGSATTVAPTIAPTAAPTARALPTAGSTTTTAPVAATTTARQGAVTLTLDPAASSASYRAREQLAGRSLASDAVGTSKAVNGTLVLTSDGLLVPEQSKVTVDLSSLRSDESRRDNFIKTNTLQTSQYPQAIFVPRQAQGLPAPLPTSGQATFQLLGDLTVHGVTRPVTWDVTAQFADAGVSGSATTNVNISDFGMTPPKVGPVLSIEDGLTLELNFSAAREA